MQLGCCLSSWKTECYCVAMVWFPIPFFSFVFIPNNLNFKKTYVCIDFVIKNTGSFILFNHICSNF
jgi:hypothetical protein